MNILAFDTSYNTCSLALSIGGQSVETLHLPAAMQQAQRILPMIQTLLTQACVAPTQLNAIAFTHGPGSFTGIRIGQSVAQGLSFAWQLPIIGISSLAALAQTVYLKTKHRQILVALDARMGQIYWGEYHIQKDHAALINDEKCCFPAEICYQINNQFAPIDYIGVGDGWTKHFIEMQNALQFQPQIAPNTAIDAKAVLQLAQLKYQRKEWDIEQSTIPVYLR